MQLKGCTAYFTKNTQSCIKNKNMESTHQKTNNRGDQQKNRCIFYRA